MDRKEKKLKYVDGRPLPDYRVESREELLDYLESFKKKYNDKNNVPRPDHWSGWNLKPTSIEFWLDGDNRIHERLKYTLDENNNWVKNLLSP